MLLLQSRATLPLTPPTPPSAEGSAAGESGIQVPLRGQGPAGDTAAGPVSPATSQPASSSLTAPGCSPLSAPETPPHPQTTTTRALYCPGYPCVIGVPHSEVPSVPSPPFQRATRYHSQHKPQFSHSFPAPRFLLSLTPPLHFPSLVLTSLMLCSHPSAFAHAVPCLDRSDIDTCSPNLSQGDSILHKDVI